MSQLEGNLEVISGENDNVKRRETPTEKKLKEQSKTDAELAEERRQMELARRSQEQRDSNG